MAFQIQSSGSRAGVKKYISEFKLGATPPPSDAEAKQLESAKALLLSEIETLPEEFNGARVNCDGNCSPGVKVLSINVCGMKLHLE